MNLSKLHGRRIPCCSAALAGVLTLAAAALGAADQPERYTLDDYARVEKIDIHFHIRNDRPEFVELAKQDRFRFLNIVVHSPNAEELAERHRTSFAQLDAHPDRVAVASAFPMAGWDETDWTARTLAHLDSTFERGAVAVKVWKNIGMEFRDRNGRLVMIDDPQLDPVFRHLAERGMVLVGHLGEPKNCWLPVEAMTVKNDQSYFTRNPQYHMHRHPEMPSYEEQIAARDQMLDKHPKLKFLAAHMASLEWSVEAIGAFLDRYPNAMVETAARMGQIQYQSIRDRDKVRRFFIQYQDRILYGTDGGFAANASAAAAHARAQKRWRSDWKYLCTDQVQTVDELDDPVPGLDLPATVVDKVFHRNAIALLPKSWDAKRAEAAAGTTRQSTRQ